MLYLKCLVKSFKEVIKATTRARFVILWDMEVYGIIMNDVQVEKLCSVSYQSFFGIKDA